MRRVGGKRQRVARLLVVGAVVASTAIVGGPARMVASPGALASPPEGTIPDLAALGWQPVLDQGFEGTTLDTSVWSVAQNDGDTDDGINTPDTISVEGGHAVLRTYTDAEGQAHTSNLSTGTLGPHTPTWGGFDAGYGYVEARMLFPDGPRSASTFWMMSHNGNNSRPFGDPAAAGPELDIVEHGNRPSRDTDETDGDVDGDLDDDGRCDWPSTATVACSETLLAGGHWDGFEEDHKPMHDSPVQNPNPSISLQGNFHTYGLLWTPEDYRFFLDGIEVKRVTAGVTYEPEYLIVATYAHEGEGGVDYGPLGDRANDVTLVDYVRVWQRPISDVPDQSTAADTPLAVPFTVQDHTYGSTARAEPGAVTVTATSSNTEVVPDSGMVVTGDGPADPDGSFAGGGFEPGSSGWTLTGAGVWGTRVHGGTQALRLTQGGGRATQTITGLRPNTTYMVGGHYEIDLGYTDADGDGRVDPTEAFTEGGDGAATFDWGIGDVDAARPDNQEVRARLARNGETEQGWPASWVGRPWPHDYVRFTTGPTTTEVTLFVENTAYVGTPDDSDVTIDDLYVRAMVPPLRTLAVRPAGGATGDTAITLTAHDAAGTILGRDSFQLSVGAGSLRDGRFEAGEATTPWTIASGTPRLVVSQPFQVDHRLQLATTENDTMVQRVTRLQPGARYKLELTGRTAQADGVLHGIAQGYDDDGTAQAVATVSGTTTTTRSTEFVTGAGVTAADIVVFDWSTDDGVSYAEEVKLTRCASTTSCSTTTSSVPLATPPAVASAGPQHGVSGVPLAFTAELPAGASLTGVTSSNELLVPNTNVGMPGRGRRQAVTLTPMPDQTGQTTISVAYTGAPGSPLDIPVVVSDRALLQPGFEKGAQHWALSGTASVITSGEHTGRRAVQLNGAGDVRQEVQGLPHGTGYTLRGWVDGTVRVTLETVPDAPATERSQPLATATWTGRGWTENALSFTTLLCSDCTPEEWRAVRVVLTDADADAGDGRPVKVDDLSLTHNPVVRRTRDISLHSGQTDFDWGARRVVTTGRVSPNALWDPAVTSVTATDVAGFGTGVLPAANTSGPGRTSEGWPYSWWVDVRAGTTTGRSTMNVTLTDPATGNTVTEPYDVTINAGSNFNNGDFERSTLSESGVNTGWDHAWLNNSTGIVPQQPWQHLGVDDSRWPYVGPRDDNHVLRISSGAVDHTVSGLTPDTQYTVRLRAKGDGSTVHVKTPGPIAYAPTLGSVAIAPPNADNVWRDYELTFTTTASGNGSTSVVLYVIDADTGNRNDDDVVDEDDAVPASDRSCAIYAAGESCLDDIGIFETADLT